MRDKYFISILFRRGNNRGSHTSIPDPRPVIMSLEPSYDSIRRIFVPYDIPLSEILPHSYISLIGDHVTSFLMRVDSLDSISLSEYIEYFIDLTSEYDEWYTDRLEGAPEVEERVLDALPVT
jgi:hypothetical protein